MSRMGVKVLQEGQLAHPYCVLRIMWFEQHAAMDAKLRLGWVNLKKKKDTREDSTTTTAYDKYIYNRHLRRPRL